MSYFIKNRTLFVHLNFERREKITFFAITKENNMQKTANVRTKQNPRLMQREIKGGRAALYLEYYDGRTERPRIDTNGKQIYYPDVWPDIYPEWHRKAGEICEKAGQPMKKAGQPVFEIKHARRKEELRLYLTLKPKTPEERLENSEILKLAEEIRSQRERDLTNRDMGYSLNTKKVADILSYMEDYIENYSKKDVRNMRLAVNRFKTFIRERKPRFAILRPTQEIATIKREWKEKYFKTPGNRPLNENRLYRFIMKPSQLTKAMVKEFRDYLIENSEGEGAATAFARFKKIIKHATEEGVLKTNPCDGVNRPTIGEDIKKDTLTSPEIARLISTHYSGENEEIRRAFILSLYTGVRWCDVRELRYSNVDYSSSTLRFEQAKTKGHSSRSRVDMPLRSDLLELIGNPADYGKSKSDLIFDLPSHTMCNKALSRWTAKAGIDKHITWHCARHTFATQILTNGANVRVVADLLGHSDLTYIKKYTRAVDEAKAAAVNSLQPINLEGHE